MGGWFHPAGGPEQIIINRIKPVIKNLFTQGVKIMKKKIISLCLVIALVATAIAGATLAYFTDTDEVKNTRVSTMKTRMHHRFDVIHVLYPP